MIKTGVITNSSQLDNVSRAAIASLGMQDSVLCEKVGFEASVDAARKMEKKGVGVLIARGGTAELIMQEISTPVVPIPVTTQEILQAIYKAKRITGMEKPRIALISYEGMKIDTKLFAQALDIDLREYPNKGGYSNIPQTLARALEGGLDVVVGGALTVQMAQERKLKAVVLVSTVDSLRTALTEAEKLVYAIKLEQARTQRLTTLVENIQEGIMFAGPDGRIQIANQAAHKMVGGHAGLVGKPLWDVIPTTGLEAALAGHTELADEVVDIGDSAYVLSVYPVRVGTDIIGAVVNLQEGRKIARMDVRLRSSMAQKGMVARYTFRDILGSSEAVRESLRKASAFAATDSTILLLGETGTGKELFAQSIHNAGPCSNGPFVAVNCAALPPSLLESELFGYEEGAFTGANRKGKQGLVELAHNGTLFLDEISELDQYGQIRLLRFLQEKQVMRLGGGRYSDVQTRVIAASNKDLHGLVRGGMFREDLFYRLRVLTLRLPPLRERHGDVTVLARAMTNALQRRSGRKLSLSPAGLALLERYPWPGNVRELANCIELLSTECRGDLISADQVSAALADMLPHEDARLPGAGAGGSGTHSAFCMHPAPARDVHGRRETALPEAGLTLPEIKKNSERSLILETLLACRGHSGEAAARLGMHRSTLYRKMREYGLGRQHRNLPG